MNFLKPRTSEEHGAERREGFRPLVLRRASTSAPQERQQADEQLRQSTEDALRAEWGNDYRKNVNLVKSLIDTAPGIREKRHVARSPTARRSRATRRAEVAQLGIARRDQPGDERRAGIRHRPPSRAPSTTRSR
jgi:hypothetical protein